MNLPQQLYKEYNKEPDIAKTRSKYLHNLYWGEIKNKYVHHISNYWETDNFIYFHFYCCNQHFTVLYNKKKQIPVIRKVLKNDINDKPYIMNKFLYKVEGNYLATYIDAVSMLKLNQKINSTSKLKDIINNTSEIDNPILLLMHLKK